MTPKTSTSPPCPVSGPEGESLTVLTALAEIAVRLTTAGPTQLVACDVLERARAVLAAQECSVWARSVNGSGRVWGAGDELITAADVESALLGRHRSRVTFRVAEMRFGPRSVGALAVRVSEPLTDVRVKFIETLASQLASFIAYSERSRRLEGDLQTRVREVEAQKRFTEAIVDALPLGLYVIDRTYRIVVWNRKRETGMQGVSREEAIGRTIFEILHRQPAELLRREFDEVFSSGRMQQFQMESMTSGEVRTYRLSKIPMRDESQAVTHVITIGEDITDWVEARERIAQTEKLAAVGRLAAGVMHEINNPLATIAACAESMALVAAEAPGDGPEYITIIGSEVQRCKRIIDGLLDFSRPQPMQRQSLNVNTVVERALSLLKHHGRFKQLKIAAELAEHLPEVHASSEQLIQVMIALLMNAADAIPQYGRVAIRTGVDSEARTVTIEVQDEGTGIPRSQMARIFEPFYTTKEPGRGTGLGLAICYGIVAEHGGRVEVESQVGEGSTFRIVLPVEGA